jgi:hypothetical protein
MNCWILDINYVIFLRVDGVEVENRVIMTFQKIKIEVEGYVFFRI